ncbi:hypothetical protein AAK964_12165 [Tissierella praeacuta]|uniref:hypothetical protein n=1 Tax=Tissierella praeacuta TaxID=43131 RepID=UPI003516EC42
MFYNKDIEIIEDTGYLNDDGLWIDGEFKIIKTIEADVQPFSKELAYKKYSYNEDIMYRVFINPEELIKLGTIIKYKNEYYIVKKIIDWDDYWILLLDLDN